LEQITMAKEPNSQDSRIAPKPRKAAPKASQPVALPRNSQANGQPQRRSSVATTEATREGGVGAAISGFLRNSPSWLTSMVVHVVALLILGLVMLPEVSDEVRTLFSHLSEEQGNVEDLKEDPLDNIQELKVDVRQTTNAVETVQTNVEPVAPSQDLENSPAPTVDLGPAQEFGTIRSDLFDRAGSGTGGTGLKGRMDGKARAAAVAAAGGTPGSEKAVAMALKWLAEHQMADGGWSFDHRPGKCGGRCKNEGRLRDGRFGATGLALMAFLGAGQTHKHGEYKQVVYRALQFLTLNQNKQTGQMYRPGEHMYAHGIATIALCEAVGMTDDRQLLPFAKKGIAFIILAQDKTGGGWRYQPGQPGDTSVVGWQLMALKSAKWCYIKIPPETIAGVNNFLNSVQSDSGAKYGYTDPGAGAATTAIGLLCRMHLGWKKDNSALERGVRFLSNIGPSKNNMYFNYYATQVMRHWGGDEWTKWNNVMRDHLVNTQSKEGHETGSWYVGGGDHGADVGGRHYVTCMNCMTLEVYYRHFPLYQTKSTEDDFAE
jgi:hypothetical protein